MRNFLVRYAKGRGDIKMKDISGKSNYRLCPFAQSQYHISWRRFMEGVISKEITYIQK